MLLPLLLACAADGSGDLTSPLDLSLSEVIPTVVLASWEADPDATAASVDFGMDGQRTWTAPATLEDGRWTATLVGLKPDVTATVVAVEQVDGEALESEPTTIQTGSNATMPGLTLGMQEEGAWTEGFLVGTLVTNPSAAVIIDSDGEIVWWFEDTENGQVGRARLSRDGRGVWLMGINAHNQGNNSLLWVSLDGTQTTRIELGDGHHDFVEHEDGSLAWLTHHAEMIDGAYILGDTLTVRAPDGSTSTLWSIFDWREYDPEEGLQTDGGGGGGGAPAGGAIMWSHFNSLRDQDGAYLMGSLGLSALMKIDGSTGEPQWTFGSKTSDFTDADGDPILLERQHHFQLLDDSLLVFENGSTERGSSRAVEFSFDQVTPVVEEVWSYTPDPTLYTFSLGNPQRLDDGSTLVNFATSGQVDQVSPEGQVLWRLSSYLGTAFGYMDHVQGLY